MAGSGAGPNRSRCAGALAAVALKGGVSLRWSVTQRSQKRAAFTECGLCERIDGDSPIVVLASMAKRQAWIRLVMVWAQSFPTP